MPEQQSLKDAELAFLALLLRRADADEHVDGTFSDEERSSFYRAAGNYYQSSGNEIDTIRSKGVSPDEIAVVLLVARHAAIDSEQVVTLRLSGRSWAGVLACLNLSPEIFYVPVAGLKNLGPLKLRGNYAQKTRQAWNVLALSDADVVNLVNLKFIADYYGYHPEQVIALCSTGWSFAAIHAEVSRPKRRRRLTRRQVKARRAHRRNARHPGPADRDGFRSTRPTG